MADRIVDLYKRSIIKELECMDRSYGVGQDHMLEALAEWVEEEATGESMDDLRKTIVARIRSQMS